MHRKRFMPGMLHTAQRQIYAFYVIQKLLFLIHADILRYAVYHSQWGPIEFKDGDGLVKEVTLTVEPSNIYMLIPLSTENYISETVAKAPPYIYAWLYLNSFTTRKIIRNDNAHSDGLRYLCICNISQ